MPKGPYRKTLFACFAGSVTQAAINNLAPLLFVIFQDSFDISLSRIGALILINFLTQLTVDAVCVRFADKIGHRPLLVAAHILCCAGLIAMALLPGLVFAPYPALVVSVLLYAMGGGIIEVLTSPVADRIPGGQGSLTMSLLHSFYCWGHVVVVLVTTALLLILGHGAWRVLPLVWAVLPLANAVAFSRVPIPELPPEEHRLPLKALMKNKLFLVAIFVMAVSGAAELVMAQWASLFAEKGLGVSKAMGDLLGPCLFAFLMGVARLGYALMGARLKLSRVLIISGLWAVGCYLVASLSQSPLISLIACACCGLGVSLLWPGTLSLSARTFEGGGTALFSLLAMGGDMGCSLGPWLVGIIAGAAQGGLKTGVLVGTVFPVLVVAGVFVMARGSRRVRA